ncbi:Aminodeoxychorismate lyase [Phlyctema vagabunda]|uniref:Aminodeoxychorismate lyase n=1 Tax=Phlyctema vagabunda TaxID=108571 RepID=A0ABR4PM35_9HELO
MEPTFQLFSSLRFDPQLTSSLANSSVSLDNEASPFYMLAYHRDRILEAATCFGWTKVIDQIQGSIGLKTLAQVLLQQEEINRSKTALRVKVLVSHDGKITAEVNPTPDVPLENLYPSKISAPSTSASPGQGTGRAWDILPDTSRTAPSPYTRNKTTRREMYDAARERIGIQSMTEKREVLIISDQGDIMEGSLTSVFFWRNGRWATPPISSGGQAGTTRRWLLEEGLCVEEAVGVDSLREGEECWISNGVRGMSWGKVKLS